MRSGSAALGMQFSAQAPPVAQQPELVLPSFVGTAGAAAAVIDDCDPLDPAYLARISDPHETRRSPGEDHSDQTTDMTDGHQSFSHGGTLLRIITSLECQVECSTEALFWCKLNNHQCCS